MAIGNTFYTKNTTLIISSTFEGLEKRSINLDCTSAFLPSNSKLTNTLPTLKHSKSIVSFKGLLTTYPLFSLTRSVFRILGSVFGSSFPYVFPGFGLYSYLVVSLAGLIVIALVCIAFGSTIIVPTSACELATTTAQRGILAGAPVVGN